MVADLEAQGLLVAVKEHTNSIGLSQRTGVVIEPRLSQQWFLAVNKTPSTGGNSIAKNAIDAVESLNGASLPSTSRRRCTRRSTWSG